MCSRGSAFRVREGSRRPYAGAVDVVVRDAAIGDAEAIADISRRGWAAAYADLVPAEFLNSRPVLGLLRNGMST
jgi:hypothetical protein